MKTVPWILSVLLSVSLVTAAFGAEKQKPYPHYWMSIATTSQSIPGMTAEASGLAAMFGGKNMFGPRRTLQLQLESPRKPTGDPKADHELPKTQNAAITLPLLTPTEEKTGYVPSERRETTEQYEKPKARMLVYWGCGETVGKGQPKVIDTATMTPVDFAKAFAGRATTRQTPPAPRQGWTYGEWPNKDDRTEIPPESSLLGTNIVKSNYTPALSFTVDKKRDFMAPVEFAPLQKSASGALKLEWKPVPTAIGYFASAIGHNQESEETIFWSSSEVAETGFALQDYLTPGDVTRFIKDKVIFDPSKTSCTIPPIFTEKQVGMMQFIAYGEELNLTYPPKPKDPKKRWDIEWSAKLRVKSTAMMPLIAGDEEKTSRKAKPARKAKTAPEPREDASSTKDESGSGSDSPTKEIGNRLRGLFGF